MLGIIDLDELPAGGLELYQRVRDDGLSSELPLIVLGSPDHLAAFSAVSDELLSSRLLLPEEVWSVHEALTSLAPKVKIIAYLRPQHDLYPSLYSTNVKSGRVIVRAAAKRPTTFSLMS